MPSASSSPADGSLAPVLDVWREWLPRVLATQVRNSGPDLGGFDQHSNGWCDGRHAAYTLSRLLAARLWADPICADHAPLDEACELALQFVIRRQAPDGRLDLGGMFSPNEIGFAMLGLGIAHQHLTARAREPAPGFRARLLAFLKRGAAAVLAGSAYTANHRWTAAAAPLAVLHAIAPDPRYLAKIEDYLADGLDLDADGCWHEERSPNYNHVATAGLLVLADQLGRPALLEPLRRHGQFLLHSLQPNGEMDSTVSHRQDRAEPDRTPCTFGVARRLALLTGDGRFTTLAQQCWQKNSAPEAEMVPLLFQLTAQPGPLPEPAPFPENYDIHHRHIQQFRRRRGATLISLAADAGGHFFDTVRDQWGGARRSDDWFHLHHGDLVLETLRLAAAGMANFQPASLTVGDADPIRLEEENPGWQHPLHFRPGAPRCEMRWDWHSAAEVRWRDTGCELVLESTTPHSLAGTLCFWFRPGLVAREGARELPPLHAGQRLALHGDAPLELRAPDGATLTITGLPSAGHAWAITPPSAIPSSIHERCALLFLGLRFPIGLRLNFHCGHSRS